MLTSNLEALDSEDADLLSWVRFVDGMGYLPYSEFLEVPSGVISRLSAIRAADQLKEHRKELMDTKDKDARKKLNEHILELEKLFK